MIRYNHNKHLASLYSQHLVCTFSAVFRAVFLIRSVYYNKPVKLPRTLVHYGKDCTWVWSRVLISHSAAPRAILVSRPHPRTIFSVMHSRGNLTSTHNIFFNNFFLTNNYLFCSKFFLTYFLVLVSKVKGVVLDNMNKLTERQEQLDSLVVKSGKKKNNKIILH